MASYAEETVLFETRGRVAIITLNQPKKLNALNLDCYFRIAQLLRLVAKRDDLVFTVLTGKGRFFSAGADVQNRRQETPNSNVGENARSILQSFVSNNLEVTHAFYTHPKVLIAALNGPAVGLSAALIAHCDFVYAMPHAFLLTPFSSIGLVAEGGASRAFVERLGISKANEALIQGKRIYCDDLVRTGFVNKVFDTGKDDAKFLEEVLKEIDDRMGEDLNQDSMIRIKALIRKPEIEVHDKQLLAEVFGGMDRFVNGIPQKEFARLASGEKKHKL